jgi:hypothetical protein
MSRFMAGWGLAMIAALVLAAPGANACTGSQVLLADNFQTLTNNWTAADGNHFVKNGQLVVTPPLNGVYMYFNQGNLFTDVSACIDVTMTTAGPKMINTFAGITFWSVDVNNTYYLGIGPTGTFSVARYVAGRYIAIVGWTGSPAIKTGLNQVNHLQVVTKGTQATLLVNDKQVAVIDGQPPQGGGEVGVIAQSGPRTRNVYAFSNLKVTN